MICKLGWGLLGETIGKGSSFENVFRDAKMQGPALSVRRLFTVCNTPLSVRSIAEVVFQCL